MKILITGGAGFIGSHTAVEFLKNGYEVVIVDNYVNSKPYVLDRIKKITNKDFKFYNVDLQNQNDVEEIFKNEHIDAVIHFAALKSNADSIKYPGKYYANNMQSTFIITSLMKKYGVKKIVFSSSATVYGNNENVPIKEDEIIGEVISPYGFTKYLTELFLKDRSEHTKDYKVVALRYFNPIGAHPSGLLGEDSPDNVPNNLMLYLNDVAKGILPYLNVFGNDYKTSDGSGMRDYVHVCDVARGHVAALEYLDKTDKYYNVFNLGTGKGHTVFELIKTFEKVNNVKIPYKVAPRRPGDVEISYACVEKAKKEMGWEAIYSFEDALMHTYCFKKNVKSKF